MGEWGMGCRGGGCGGLQGAWVLIKYLHGAAGVFPLQPINALLEVFGGLQHIHLLLPLCCHLLVQILHMRTSICETTDRQLE